MNGRVFLSLMLFVLLTSCSVRQGPPEISGRRDSGGCASPQCPAFFPDGKWQFVHSIGFHMAGGGDGTAIGVLALDKDEIRCVLTTVEGLSCFRPGGRRARPVMVSRGIPPFDKQEFAAGLMADVRTIFRRPEGDGRMGTVARWRSGLSLLGRRADNGRDAAGGWLLEPTDLRRPGRGPFTPACVKRWMRPSSRKTSIWFPEGRPDIPCPCT